MIVVEWAIPISALILSGAAVLISVISHLSLIHISEPTRPY